MLALCLSLLSSEEERQQFSKIYEREHPELLRFAMARLGNWHAAEEVVGDAFYSLAKNFPRYAGNGRVGMHRLLVTIVRNNCADYLEKQGRELVWLDEDRGGEAPASAAEGGLRQEHPLLAEAALQRHAEQGGTEEQTIRRQMLQDAMRHIHALPEEMKQVYLLRHYAGLPPRKIAAQLDLPVKTVNQRLYRAQLKIEEGLRKDGYEIGGTQHK